jgi:hypothetical protein
MAKMTVGHAPAASDPLSIRHAACDIGILTFG